MLFSFFLVLSMRGEDGSASTSAVPAQQQIALHHEVHVRQQEEGLDLLWKAYQE